MNDKGQALVEFVLVLPILVLLIFGMIEIGNIIYKKYELETHIEPVIKLYENEEDVIDTYAKKNNININFSKDGNLVTLTIDKDISLLTPGLTNFLGNPYKIKAKRSFYVGDSSEE